MRNNLDDTFLALSDKTRLAVIELLVKAPLCSSEIAESLGTTRPTMSRHLSVLRRAGFIEETSQGEDARVRVYQLKRERFSEMRDFIDEVEAFWGDKLASFKAHAEKKYGKKDDR
jgi:DNA-binding transcriptional ArsR family regulator